jgi:hypothetical protein
MTDTLPTRVPVRRIVIKRRTRRLHLLQRHPSLDHVLNAVADDGEHVAIVHHVGEARDTAVSRQNSISLKNGLVWFDGSRSEFHRTKRAASLIVLPWEP